VPVPGDTGVNVSVSPAAMGALITGNAVQRLGAVLAGKLLAVTAT